MRITETERFVRRTKRATRVWHYRRMIRQNARVGFSPVDKAGHLRLFIRTVLFIRINIGIRRTKGARNEQRRRRFRA